MAISVFHSGVYKNLPGRLYPPLLEMTSLTRQEKWLSTLNNSDGISGTALTLPQPEEWITSKVPTPSPHSTNKEVPQFSHTGPSCHFKHCRLVCFHSTQVLQETGDSSPTQSRFNHVPSGDTLRQDAISSFIVCICLTPLHICDNQKFA